MESTPQAKLSVRYNGESVIEYDRNTPLPERQQDYLEKMDRSMDKGIEIDGRVTPAPDREQRLEFVAGQLYQALLAENDGMIAAMCAYLASRQADAVEVLLDDRDGDITIELRLGSADGRVHGIPITLN